MARKLFDCRGLFVVALVAATLVARGEAHLHLGVDATGMARVGMKIVDAAAQQKELEHFVGVAFGRGAGGERSVGPIGFALAGAMCDAMRG